MFLMQISRLRFKQSRISMLISHIYVLGCFVNFLVIFRYIWREIVFLKGLVKLMEIGNLRFVVVLKLEFEIKNWYIHSKQLPNNLGCHCAVGQLSGGVP